MSIEYVILAIVEGFTEFLPVSSTAHLIIFSSILNTNLNSETFKFYILFIQLGALLAGVFAFKDYFIKDRKSLLTIFIGFIPSALFGFVFYKLFKSLLSGNFILMILTLFIGGMIMILLEKKYSQKQNIKNSHISVINNYQAIQLGIAQALAIIPGVSRSGAVIMFGMYKGIEKKVLIEFTFLLAIPTIFTATLYDFYKIYKFVDFKNNIHIYVYGFTISFITAYILLYFLKKYLNKINIGSFGYYRIILSILLLFMLY